MTARPEWAAAGTFAQAWKTTEQLVRGAIQTPTPVGRLNLAALQLLGRCHVVTVSSDQVAALPAFSRYDDGAQAFEQTRPPFDPVYLSLDDAPMTLMDPPGWLRGSLVGTFYMEGFKGRRVCVMPMIGNAEAPPFFYGYAYVENGAWRVVDAASATVGAQATVRGRQVTQRDIDDSTGSIGDAAQIVTQVLYLLESANVLVEEAPVSRQERRHTQRKNGRVALTVHIRAPKRRHDRGGDVGLTRWTSRWEVRGHYKHFTKGPTFEANPDQRIPYGDGQCVRVWCPPHVKGPEDKPLIPKVRVI